MAEKEYIERSEAKRIILENEWKNPVVPNVVNMILDRVPAADVMEVRHAIWIEKYGKTWCSRCDASNKQYKPPYCPHCGAKMDGGNHENN